MIWSIIPEEIIFQQENAVPKRNFTQYLGRQVQTVAHGEGKARIISVISSNPADFLDMRFAPGTIINAQEAERL